MYSLKAISKRIKIHSTPSPKDSRDHSINHVEVLFGRHRQGFREQSEHDLIDRVEETFLEQREQYVCEQIEQSGAQKVSSAILTHVNISPLTSPKSDYFGWSPHMQKSTINAVLNELLTEWERRPETRALEPEILDFVEFQLENFAIYRKKKTWGPNKVDWNIENELCRLDLLNTQPGSSELFFDGTIAYGQFKRYVQNVPFEILSVDGYFAIEHHPISRSIWIRPHASVVRRNDIYLRLGQPAPEYRRYYKVFLWIANFARHLVDYLAEQPNARLHQFTSDFGEWVEKEHGNSSESISWLSAKSSLDFRTALAAHVKFVWKEAASVSTELHNCRLWKEIDPDTLDAIPTQKFQACEGSKTTVTPFVYSCFGDLYFGPQLASIDIEEPVIRLKWRKRVAKLGFPDPCNLPNYIMPPPAKQYDSTLKRIKKGQIIGVARDDVTRWRCSASVWYLYVTSVKKDGKGMFYRGIWLYQSQDTTLGEMFYPWGNELFMSDHCNCKDGRIRQEEVVDVLTVEWSPASIPLEGHFVRQTYLTDQEQYAFRTFQPGDYICAHMSKRESERERAERRYAQGDTILLTMNDTSEPAVIHEIDRSSDRICVRLLARAFRDFKCPNARPNHLVWTDRTKDIDWEDIKSRCQIRFAATNALAQDESSRLYNRDGQGNLFLITKRLVVVHGKEVVSDMCAPHPDGIKEAAGWSEELRKFDTLSLFSGCGNFDRGIEEGGASEIACAVEWDAQAAHSYLANCQSPDKANIFLGSVDEHLARALKGEFSDLVPSIDAIDALVAGSPCQGFSDLQQNKLSSDSMKNASKIANVASYIDFYRPSYCVLENVPAMTKWICGKNKQDVLPKREASTAQQNVFCQLMCSLVAMGYQVEQFLLKAYNYGAPQQRPRLIIVAVAPGLPLLEQPVATHKSPPELKNKTLGTLPSGEPFGIHDVENAPFNFVSATEGTELPDIDDGHVEGCIEYPDHRRTCAVGPRERLLINCIPKNPPGLGLREALELDLLPDVLQVWISGLSKEKRSKGSKSWRRVQGSRLFPAITTSPSPSDSRNGFGVHWSQDRVLTLLEAKRAQGFLDDEVLIGSWPTKWRLVGNSVARPVALALGLSLREAWLKIPQTARTPIVSSGSDQPGLDTVELDRQNGYHGRARSLSVRSAPNSLSPCIAQPVKSAKSSKSYDLITSKRNTPALGLDGKIESGKHPRKDEPARLDRKFASKKQAGQDTHLGPDRNARPTSPTKTSHRRAKPQQRTTPNRRATPHQERLRHPGFPQHDLSPVQYRPSNPKAPADPHVPYYRRLPTGQQKHPLQWITQSRGSGRSS